MDVDCRLCDRGSIMKMDSLRDVNCNGALFCDGWFVSIVDCIIEVNWD